jgi:hypothetical protein
MYSQIKQMSSIKNENVSFSAFNEIVHLLVEMKNVTSRLSNWATLKTMISYSDIKNPLISFEQ